MRNEFAKALYNEISTNRDIMLLVGDCGQVVFDDIKRDFPDNFINMGIAEQNMITVACGMAAGGLIPFVYTIIPFLIFRPFEQVRNDVCYQNRNVKLVGVGAGGKYKSQGFTHHVEDALDMKMVEQLPNITVFWPAYKDYVGELVRIMLGEERPFYLRID